MTHRAGCLPSPSLRITALAGVVAMTIATSATAQGPSKPAGPPPLARYFPREDLVVYAEFDGLDAHREAWKKTATYRVLNETTTGAMLEQTLARFLDEVVVSGTGVPARGREVVDLGEHLLRSGFAVGINRRGGAGLPRSFGIVIRGGAKGQSRAILDRFLRAGEGPRSKIKQVQKSGGRSVQVLSDSPRTAFAWWAEGDDLAISIVSPSGVDAMLAALDGREPNAVEHPTRVALRKSDDAAGFEPVGLAFFDMAALPPLPREAVALGLDRVQRFDYRWGFHGRAIESIVGAVVPAPRTGIPALFDQPGFDARHLPPLPDGLRGFTVLSLDVARLYDQIAGALKAIDPNAARPMAEFEAAAQQALGMRLREDLLAPLGSRIAFYSFPAAVDAPAGLIEGLARALVVAPRSAVVLELRDREAAARALARLAERAGQSLPIVKNPSPGPTVAINVAAMRPLEGPDTGYLFLPASPSFHLPAGMHPAILLGRDELVFGTTIATARRARDLHERNQPGLRAGDPLAEALGQLPDRLTFLSVSDSRRSLLPDLIVGVPGLAEFLIDRRRSGPFGFFGLPFIGPIRPASVRVEPLPFPPPPGVTPEPPGAAPGTAGEGPKDTGSTLAFDPELIPEADDLRPVLFPSVSALSVDDRGIRFLSREAFPTINPATAVPVAIAMMIPAAHSSRLAARRAQSVNNLKQIGLAMHNFQSANDRFPADVRAKDGKPLLSWRVQILPFIEQMPLFNEFKLDEPWDSPHNKALLERMPSTFAVPGSPAEPGMTFYRGFSGQGALFDLALPQGVELAKITDGTSNTIALVEAREAVPWTRPEGEIPFKAEPQKPETLRTLVEPLGGHASGGFNALFCDGSVRFLRETINPIVLRAIITRDGGEVVSSDSF
jgi:prepilin-type processing-associated H-X9-DG protein